jgi:hypothetical protein
MHDHFEVQGSVCMMGAQLKDQVKINRMGLSLQHLLWYADEGEDMLNRTFTGNEAWVHHYQPVSKQASLQWKHSSSPSTKTFKVTPAAGKVMLTMFGNYQGVLLTHFQ